MAYSTQDAIRRRQEYEARQKAQQARVKEAQRLKDIQKFRTSQYAQGAEDLDDMAALGLGRQLREQEERQARQEKTGKEGLEELLRMTNPEEWVKFKADQQMSNYRPGVGQQPDRAQLEASLRDQSQFSERERVQRAVEEGRNKPQPPKMVQMSDLMGLPKVEQERLLPYVGKANPFQNLRNTLSQPQQIPSAPQAPTPSRSGGRQGIRSQQPAQQQPQAPQQPQVSDDVRQLSQFIVSQIGTKPKQQPQQPQQQQAPQPEPVQEQEPPRRSVMNRGMMRQDLESDPNRSLQQLQQQRPQIGRR